VPHDHVRPKELVELVATNSVTLEQQAVVSFSRFLLLWQTSWRCPWMRRPPAHTVNGAQVRSKRFSPPTSPTCTPAMKLTSPSASDGSGSSASAQPWSGSWTAGTTPRASRGSSVPIPNAKQTTSAPLAAKCSTSAPPAHRSVPCCSGST